MLLSSVIRFDDCNAFPRPDNPPFNAFNARECSVSSVALLNRPSDPDELQSQSYFPGFPRLSRLAIELPNLSVAVASFSAKPNRLHSRSTSLSEPAQQNLYAHPSYPQ